MKRKSIFCSSKEKNRLQSTYDVLTIERSAKELLPFQVYYIEDIITAPEDFKEVQFIFSGWNMPVFTASEIEQYFPALEAVFYAAGTVKYFAEPFLRKGIRVYSARFQNGESVAEFVCAQILLANKGYFMNARKYVKGFRDYSEVRQYALTKRGNYHSKIGIIGAGAVGIQVMRKLKAVSPAMEIFVYDPYTDEEYIKIAGGELTSLEEIFSSCDIVSNHLPNISETVDLLDYRLFALMKDDAVFINTGRGQQVVEEDLARALTEEPKRTALLDVLRREPITRDHVFLDLDNCFLTSHIAGANVGQDAYRMGDYMISVYRKYLAGEVHDPSEVTLEMLKHMA